jgi:hypothetical protein
MFSTVRLRQPRVGPTAISSANDLLPMPSHHAGWPTADPHDHGRQRRCVLHHNRGSFFGRRRWLSNRPLPFFGSITQDAAAESGENQSRYTQSFRYHSSSASCSAFQKCYSSRSLRFRSSRLVETPWKCRCLQDSKQKHKQVIDAQYVARANSRLRHSRMTTGRPIWHYSQELRD